MATTKEKDTDNIILQIVDKLVRNFKPEKIILFGSYAHGNTDKHSDLDLLIIKKNREEAH